MRLAPVVPMAGRLELLPGLHNPTDPAAGATVMIHLSHRQRQVVGLIAAGLTNDETAQLLGISPRTARAHVEAVKEKLRVRRRREIPSAFRRITGQDPFDIEQ